MLMGQLLDDNSHRGEGNVALPKATAELEPLGGWVHIPEMGKGGLRGTQGRL